MRGRALRAAALTAVLAVAPGLPAIAAPAELAAVAKPLSAFPRERIAIETRSARRHVFAAWRADTPQTRAQGLMFVPELGPDQAMIFVYAPAQQVGMWMMNTLIHLDMLFVDEAGCVVKVHERAEPGSLDTISSGAPVVLVVELAGGTASRLGIAAGDRVLRTEAGWPRTPRPCTAKG
jgi:uncharacterized membrane protein (UPF0127 family)